MVIVQIWGPWRSLEPLDACAPVSQFQPLHSYTRYTLGIETAHHWLHQVQFSLDGKVDKVGINPDGVRWAQLCYIGRISRESGGTSLSLSALGSFFSFFLGFNLSFSLSLWSLRLSIRFMVVYFLFFFCFPVITPHSCFSDNPNLIASFLLLLLFLRFESPEKFGENCRIQKRLGTLKWIHGNETRAQNLYLHVSS